VSYIRIFAPPHSDTNSVEPSGETRHVYGSAGRLIVCCTMPVFDDADQHAEDVNSEQPRAIRRDGEAADETLRHRVGTVRSLARHQHRAASTRSSPRTSIFVLYVGRGSPFSLVTFGSRSAVTAT